MSGGKGGARTTKVEIDPRLAEGSAGLLAQAMRTASEPYRPNRGIQLAAFSPRQNAAFQSADAAASAYGLPAGGPRTDMRPQRSSTGILGFSPSGLYDESVRRSFSPADVARRAAILREYGNVANRINNLGGNKTSSNKLIIDLPPSKRPSIDDIDHFYAGGFHTQNSGDSP